MSAAGVLRRIQDNGGDISLEHGKVVVKGASRLPVALITEARAHKAELIAMLQKHGYDRSSEAAYEATERAAIIANSLGDARAPVPHHLPPSWSDGSIEPTAGARCYGCTRSTWWTEPLNPMGWRCMVCHPPAHLQAGEYREVVT